MAKEHRESKPSKVRIFFGFAEVEGGDSTVEDSVRNIASAVVRAVQPTPPPRVVRALPPAASTTPKLDNQEDPGLFDQSDEAGGEALDNPDILDGALPDAERPEKSDKDDKRTRNPKKAVSYTFVTDLNLRPSNKPSLHDFYAEKKPQGQQEQVALFVYYLGKTLGVVGIGANHLYTCFQDAKQRVPKDITQIARNTFGRKGWVDVTDVRNLRITTAGENFVEHDLPASGS